MARDLGAVEVEGSPLFVAGAQPHRPENPLRRERYPSVPEYGVTSQGWKQDLPRACQHYSKIGVPMHELGG
jgi:hypothetical protein